MMNNQVNSGGFRYLGTKENPELIILTSNFVDLDWPDNLDLETGILTYYGDNKHPGRLLLETPRFGNLLLQNMFEAIHTDPPRRRDVPPILVFASTGVYRDMRFLGLAVPGASDLTGTEDLLAVWKITEKQRFQNYKASFSILGAGHIPRSWIEDIKKGEPLSDNCPPVWKKWVNDGTIHSLKSEKSTEYRNKTDQLPDDDNSKKLIGLLYNYFKDSPFEFEKCATEIALLMDRNFYSFDVTRPSRDGGRDAVGFYRIGCSDSSISVECSLEAKCYDLNNSVGVRDVSRLISRLRHRQFGILVTTSYLNSQAYKELKEDKHPVIIIAAADILRILANVGYNTEETINDWLIRKFPMD